MKNTVVKWINAIIIILLLIFNVVFFVKVIVLEKLNKNEKLAYEKKNKEEMRWFIHNMYLSTHEFVINQEILHEIENQIELPCLIYSYTNAECEDCIFEDLELLKKMSNEFNKQRILILPVMNDSKLVNIRLKSELHSFVYKKLDEHQINLPVPVDGNSTRFFAVLSSSGKIIIPFSPSLLNTQKTNIYLEFIFSQYFENFSH